MNKRERLFWEKVKRLGPNACWEWQASCSGSGYGAFRDGKTMVGAHRYVWKITNGPILEGLCVLHHCDNKKCVNPNHLFLGTKADNNRDMVAKGRQARQKGEEHGCSKLTAPEVLDIRKRYATEDVLQQELAEQHDVSNQLISDIVNRQNWQHI